VRAVARRGELRLYGIGLIITALAYPLFGVRYGAPARHFGVEAVGALLYTAAAVAGLRRWPMLLALGWSTHVVWDLFLHHAEGQAFAPEWYPVLCVGFDLLLGGYVAGVLRAPSIAK
jgi:hypothetical protein